jgi:hypothetical protein
MKNLIQATVVTLFAASTAQAQQAVQWKVSDGGNGHWYQLVVDVNGLTWPTARQRAIAVGGDLAVLSRQGSTEFVQAMLSGAMCGGSTGQAGPYVGGFQDLAAPDYSEPSGGWRWVDGSPFPGSAAVSLDDNLGHQDYLHFISLQPSCSGPFVLDDVGLVSNANRSFIVEWSADCNGDGIVDYGQCHDGTLPDYNGNNIPDCCERGEPCVVDHYPVQWRVEDSGNGHWYRFVPVLTDWQAALAAARTNGADLVSITSAAEGEFLRHLGSTPTAWMGAVQALGGCEPGCEWQWSDGSAWGYQNWDPQSGEPNDGGCCWPSNEDVGEFRFGNGRWNDFLASALVPSLVEWSTDCDADGIVDYGQLLTGQLADSNTDGVPDVCQQPNCVDADLFRDFNVNGADLGILLSQWGPNSPLTVSDINSDGVVNGADLGLLLSFWGPCD